MGCCFASATSFESSASNALGALKLDMTVQERFQGQNMFSIAGLVQDIT
jgi:hypothetical protein